MIKLPLLNVPLSYAVLEWPAGGIFIYGLCPSCGHLFSVCKDKTLFSHREKGRCAPGIHSPDCGRHQRPEPIGTKILFEGNLATCEAGFDTYMGQRGEFGRPLLTLAIKQSRLRAKGLSK